MTNSAELHPAQIPGYDGGPLSQRTELLDDPLFWLGHLYSCVMSEEAEELLFGADYEAAEQFHRRLRELDDWPTFTIPVDGGHVLHVVCRTLKDDSGTDYLLYHSDWEQAELLARDDGHFMGPGLSWPELVSVADSALPGGSTNDPHARLLLLLPAFGDDALPDVAVDRLASALRACTGVEAPELLATAILDGQGQCGPAHWSVTAASVRINDGSLSFRNPGNAFALPATRLARVATALST
ncbi:hypothetical protein ACFVVA_38060 [Kitasatospora sp. NPDC058048]|uniref:hypothetical protein n=1 Tax=Kitasatospora sp. NPDC058048 TaxID=3346313 RepID=UPI0036DA5E70